MKTTNFVYIINIKYECKIQEIKLNICYLELFTNHHQDKSFLANPGLNPSEISKFLYNEYNLLSQ